MVRSNSITSDVENNIGEKTENVNSWKEAYCDGEPDKVNPCFIIIAQMPVRCNG